jgi:hypothetical protein
MDASEADGAAKALEADRRPSLANGWPMKALCSGSIAVMALPGREGPRGRDAAVVARRVTGRENCT